MACGINLHTALIFTGQWCVVGVSTVLLILKSGVKGRRVLQRNHCVIRVVVLSGFISGCLSC